jgi:hypothetical protein
VFNKSNYQSKPRLWSKVNIPITNTTPTVENFPAGIKYERTKDINTFKAEYGNPKYYVI